MLDACPEVRQLLVDVDTPCSEVVCEELGGEARAERDTGGGVYLEGKGGRGRVVVAGGAPEAVSGAIGVICEGGFMLREGLRNLAPGDRHRVVVAEVERWERGKRGKRGSGSCRGRGVTSESAAVPSQYPHAFYYICCQRESIGNFEDEYIPRPETLLKCAISINR